MAEFSKNVGPVEIVLDGTSLGLTLGGAELVATREVFRSIADATGNTARGKYVVGESVMVRTQITEATHAQLAKILGTTVDGSTTEAVTFKSAVGKDLLEDAAECILKPIVEGVVSTTEADWIYIPVASISPDFAVPIQIAGQKAWRFEIEGHPVKAEHIGSTGHLYNSGSPEYAVKDLLRMGKATSV
jgi:hypothetical protein